MIELDLPKAKKVLKAHEMLFHDMLESQHPVINLKGVMIGGPDRRSDEESIKWRNWKDAVAQALATPGLVPAHVRDYMGKHLATAKPPQKIEDAILTKPFTPPRFTWSWSQYSSFLTCPAKWMAEKYFKTIPYVESEAMRVGNMIHETAENYTKSKIGQQFKNNKIHTQYLPSVQRYCDALVAAHNSGARILVEEEMCVTNKFQKCGWWDNDIVWYRGKADVVVIKDNKLTVWDYKSGAHKPEFMQLKMMCAFAALYYPEIEVFDGRLLFLKHNKVEAFEKPLLRSELKPILAEVLSNVRRMEATWEEGEGQARKNGLCRQYCGNKACPHEGR